MPLALGTRLGPYEITGALGKGGMGEVYRAMDTKLAREVAIKVLPAAFAQQPERLARFEREAKVLASLNHPNIATIYAVEESAEGKALVMELVKGETLKGPVALETAIHYGMQITSALEAAHDRGITHRDLKPANIMLTSEGVIKVLDFGLAAVTQPSEAEDAANLATLTMSPTQAGMILGTAGYMPPEQARGKPVDKRADIWAFGVVFYELLTGKRLFQGDDIAATLAAVIMSEPHYEGVPPRVERLLKSCLEKDPRKRLRDIGDVWRLLGEDAPKSAAEILPPAPIRSRFPWALAAAAIIALLALGALAAVHFRETPPVLQAVQFGVEAPPETAFGFQYAGFAPSPDGRYIVLSVDPDGSTPPSLWLRPLDSTAARTLPGTENGNSPTWSPDSRSLVFFADGKLKRIEIAGGAPLTLSDTTDDPLTPAGTWNRSGVILFGSAKGLMRVSASGGGATELTHVDPAAKETGHGYPQFLPDGNRFLYFVDSNDPNVQGVYTSSLDAPDQRRLIVHTSAKAVYVPPRFSVSGYLLWMQGSTLLAQRFDERSLQQEGDPVSVAEGIGLNPNIPARAAFWASDAGVLIYFSDATGSARPAVWVSADGTQREQAMPNGFLASLALSPDGTRIAVQRPEQAQGNQDIWLWESARKVLTRLTFDSATDMSPTWSPDGKQVAFSSNRDGPFQIYRKDASGAGQEERLTEGPIDKIVVDWSRDGRYLLYLNRNSESGGSDLMALPLEGGKPALPVVHTNFAETTGALSPDGRWVAYASNQSGNFELYAQASPGAEGAPPGRWQISSGGAWDAKWRADGRELYFASLDGRIMAASIQAGPQGLQAGTPRELFRGDYINYQLGQFDVTRDGKRFLMLLFPAADNSRVRLNVVSNWQAALRK